jgi:hypothetical protein
VDWIELVYDVAQLVGFLENGNEPSGSIKAGNVLTS